MTSENDSDNFDYVDLTDSEDDSSSSSSSYSEYSSESKDDASTDSEAEIQALQRAYNNMTTPVNMTTPIPLEFDEKDDHHNNNNMFHQTNMSYHMSYENINQLNNTIKPNQIKHPDTPAPFKTLPPLKPCYSTNNTSLTIRQKNASLKREIIHLQKQNAMLIANQRTYKYSEHMNHIRKEIHLQKSEKHMNRQTRQLNAKYIKMKTLKIPKNVIKNRMRLDGQSQIYINTFFQNINKNNNNNNISNEKMKHIHWKPIKYDKLNDSIWNKINHKWNDYDNKKFSLKFQIRKNKPPKLNKYILNKKINRLHSGANILKNGKGIRKKNNKRNKLAISMSKTRWDEIKIGLKSFHMTNEELRNIILNLNENKMNVKRINNLLNIIPTPMQQLEIEKMSLKLGYEEIRNFDIIERFFYSLYDIIELKQRLKKWIFKLQFEMNINALISDISVIENAKVNIILSKELLIIFTILLKFGNAMNYNNKRNSNAYGFIISDLVLLNQIKTFDNSMTFTMYLYSFIRKKYPNLLDNIIKKFEIVNAASDINSEIIYEKYEIICEEINDLNDMIIRHNEEYDHGKNDLFVSKMMKFQHLITDNMCKLDNKIKSLRQCEIQLQKYFAYNNKTTIQNIFKHIGAFICMLRESKIKLKQFEENRRLRNLNKRNGAGKFVRSNTDRLTRNSMKKFVKKTKQYALSIEDIGTPLVDEKESKNYDSILYLFDEQKEREREQNKNNNNNKKQKLKPMQSATTMSNSEFDSDSDYDYNEYKCPMNNNSNCKIKLKINLDVNYNNKIRRNSDPSTTTPTPTSANSLVDRINMFESNIKNDGKNGKKKMNKNRSNTLKPGNNNNNSRRRRTRTFSSQFVEKSLMQSK